MWDQLNQPEYCPWDIAWLIQERFTMIFHKIKSIGNTDNKKHYNIITWVMIL